MKFCFYLFKLAVQSSLSTGRKNTATLKLVSSSVSFEGTELGMYNCIKTLLLMHWNSYSAFILEKSSMAMVFQIVSLGRSIGFVILVLIFAKPFTVIRLAMLYFILD